MVEGFQNFFLVEEEDISFNEPSKEKCKKGKTPQFPPTSSHLRQTPIPGYSSA